MLKMSKVQRHTHNTLYNLQFKKKIIRTRWYFRSKANLEFSTIVLMVKPVYRFNSIE